MFRYITPPPPAIKTTLIATTLALSAFSLNAHATLTSYSGNGADLVYSSVSDVTWTKDANLLGTWIASSTDGNSNGTLDIIDAIIAASPTISNSPNHLSPTGTYTLSASDFRSNGRTTWFGALAYVNYLNSINYGGSTAWYLPTVANTSYGFNIATNGTAKGDELFELYYQELGSKGIYDSNWNYQPDSDYGIVDPQNKFINEQSWSYWSGTEYAPNPTDAWSFNTNLGYQDYLTKPYPFYAWAVSPGQIAAVPEPESVAMLLVGLAVACGVVRRRQTKTA